MICCCPSHAERIGGLYLAACRAGAFCEEIADELCRCAPVGAAKAIGSPLADTLEFYACKRIVAGEIIGRDVNEESGVCVAAGAGVETGAVDAQMAGL